MAGHAVVGLTGGIACGKSTVCARLRARGVTVVDADEAAHALTAPGGAGLAALTDTFGTAILAADGGLDRPALRARLFADPALRRRVEGILHPLILARLETGLATARGAYAVLAAPLLVETGLTARVVRVVVVDCAPEIQRARLLARDGADPAAADQVLAAQADRATRLAAADDVLVNAADLATLHDQVDELDVFLRRLAATGAWTAAGRRLPRRLPR